MSEQDPFDTTLRGHPKRGDRKELYAELSDEQWQRVETEVTRLGLTYKDVVMRGVDSIAALEEARRVLAEIADLLFAALALPSGLPPEAQRALHIAHNALRKP